MTSGEGVARRFPELACRWLQQTPQRFASAIATALRDRAKRGEPDVPNPELAVIQFYALTVYPHIVRSMFGISLDPQATEELLTSGVDTFLSYYRPAARHRQPAPDSLAPVRKARRHHDLPDRPACGRLHRCPPSLAAGHLPPGPRPGARRPRGHRNHKATTRPYFVLDGNICALQAAKDHVNVFLSDGAIVPDTEGIITGGHDNKTAARRVAIRDGQTINAPALTAVFRQIIADNRAGGWRKLKRAT